MWSLIHDCCWVWLVDIPGTTQDKCRGLELGNEADASVPVEALFFRRYGLPASHWARMAKTEGFLFRQVVCRHILMSCSCLFTNICGNEEARVLVVFLYHRLWEVSSVALAVSILFSFYEVPFCISSFKVQVGFCAHLSIQTNFGFSDSCVVSCILIKVVLQGNDGWAKVPKVLKFLFHNC